MSIGTITGNDVVSGYLDIGGTYWEVFATGSAIFANQDVAVGGVQGVGVRHGGFRNRLISCNLCYVAASDASCESNFISDIESIEDTPITVTLPNGKSYDNCYLLKATQSGSPKPSTSAFYLITTYVLEQKRPN